MPSDEGYIKFQLDWQPADPVSLAEISELNDIRQRLYRYGWIGFDEQLKVGFGNLSRRDASHHGGLFLISGTQTGARPQLTGAHYTWVTHYDLAQNQLSCRGPLRASSESMTHAAAYAASAQIGAVLHIHHRAAWEAVLHQWPTTPVDVAYGTPAMAQAVQNLLGSLDTTQPQLIAMGGHEEGLLATGATAATAYAHLAQAMEEVMKRRK